jgi:hypothetical protein
MIGHSWSIPAMNLYFFLAMLFTVTDSPDPYRHFPFRALLSPRGTFAIIQLKITPEGWQPWVLSLRERSPAYKLESFSGSYISTFHVSRDEHHLFQEQKTGSGNNAALLYTCQSGIFRIDPSQNPRVGGKMQPMSEALSNYFGDSTELGNPFDHFWVSWKNWDRDGISVEMEVSGSHCDGDFHVDGWSAHYNMCTGRFYLTPDEAVSNRCSIAFSRRVPKDERTFRSAVGLPKKPLR